MRILRSIVGTLSLLVQSREANFAKRRSVGSEFVGDDYRRNEALTSKQFPQQPQRRGLVALGLDQDFENLAFAGHFRNRSSICGGSWKPAWAIAANASSSRRCG